MNPVNPTNLPPQSGKSADTLMSLAQHAVEAGDTSLGMHLYLAAFEQAQNEDHNRELAEQGLREAWDLAVDLKERSIAEYIFEKLEDRLSPDDLLRYSDSLQRLSIDKLIDFGFSPEELTEMANNLDAQLAASFGVAVNGIDAEDVLGEEVDSAAEEEARRRFDFLNTAVSRLQEQGIGAQKDSSEEEGSKQNNASKPQTTRASSDADEDNPVKRKISEILKSLPEDAEAAVIGLVGDAGLEEFLKEQIADNLDVQKLRSRKASSREADPAQNSMLGIRVSYKDLVGYDSAIATMRNYGLGVDPTNQFYHNFADRLRRYHGITRLPARNTFLFTSSSREDANHFMAATVMEMGLPCLRMCIEETVSGAPMLCVMSNVDLGASLGQGKMPFNGPGVILLEDLDMWEVIIGDGSAEDLESQGVSNPRGLKELLGLIRMSVQNPHIYILASVSSEADLGDTYLDLIAPFTVIPLEAPNLHERMAIILDLMDKHPSLQGFDASVIASLSNGLSRYDLYQGITEAVEEAFQESLNERRVIPISNQNLLSKLAGYHMEGSHELKLIEDILVYEFMQELNEVTSTTKGTS